MPRRTGCLSVVVVTGLVVAFLDLCLLACPDQPPGAGSGSLPARWRAEARPAVCLEAWVRLRSYRGCPVLAAAGGYRLQIYCPFGARSGGELLFAGPFPGRAYVSERPVPLGTWVHLAGVLLPRPGQADPNPGAPPPGGPVAPAAAILFDGVDVSGGGLASFLPPLPLGHDPAQDRAAGRAGRPDGKIGAWRLSRRGRSLAQIAASRGTPWRLAPFAARAPPAAAAPASGRLAPFVPTPLAPGAPVARSLGSGPTRRGWAILAAGLLVAAAMTGAGLTLRRLGGRSCRRSAADRQASPHAISRRGPRTTAGWPPASPWSAEPSPTSTRPYARPARASSTFDMAALEKALNRLAEIDEQQAHIVELRCLAGLEVEETAEILGLSTATVERESVIAAAWLYRELHGRGR